MSDVVEQLGDLQTWLRRSGISAAAVDAAIAEILRLRSAREDGGLDPVLAARLLMREAREEAIEMCATVVKAHKAEPVIVVGHKYEYLMHTSEIDQIVSSIRSLSSVEPKSGSEPVGYICTGCERFSTDPAADLEKIRADGGISCCPERNAVPLYASPSQSVPEGWVIVPREPTEEMLDAGYDWDDAITATETHPRNRGVYRAMLAHAPSPPEKEDE